MGPILEGLRPSVDADPDHWRQRSRGGHLVEHGCLASRLTGASPAHSFQPDGQADAVAVRDEHAGIARGPHASSRRIAARADPGLAAIDAVSRQEERT
jgi:hypothetical protein